MDKIVELPLDSLVDFKTTLCPIVNAPVTQGILKKYCRTTGWQSIMDRESKNMKHYPVQLAVVELPDGERMRVNAKGIIGLTTLALVPAVDGTRLLPVTI